MPTRNKVSTASPYEKRFGFCRAVRVGNVISIAGTAPIGPDGKTAGIGDPAAQARRCFQIFEEVLGKLDASLSDVVRTRMFLTRIDDWPVIGEVHGEFFGRIQPVATMLEVSRLIDPDWFIEVEADAVVE